MPRLLCVLALLAEWAAAAAAVPSPLTAVTTGTSILFTHHADDKCQLTPFAGTVPRQADGSKLGINACVNSALGNRKLICKIGASKFSILELVYGAADNTCNASPVQQNGKSVTIIFASL